MKAQRIWFTEDQIVLHTEDGWTGSLLLRAFPTLLRATDTQRNSYELSSTGIHWPELDEDLSFEGFFTSNNVPDNPIADTFKQRPEINVRQFARRIQMNKTLLAKYICGYSKPSQKRTKEIEAGLHALGSDLQKITI